MYLGFLFSFSCAIVAAAILDSRLQKRERSQQQAKRGPAGPKSLSAIDYFAGGHLGDRGRQITAGENSARDDVVPLFPHLATHRDKIAMLLNLLYRR